MNIKSVNKENKRLFIICAITLVLLLLRCYSSSFVLPLFLLGCIVILYHDKNLGLPFLFFLLPSAFILKLSVEDISLFTLMSILYVLKIVFTEKLSVNFYVILFYFFIYCVFVSGLDKIIPIASMILGFVMIKHTSSSKVVNSNKVLYCYTFGFIVASFIALFKENFTEILPFIQDVRIKLQDNEYAGRFSGLQGNPNYYTLDASLILSSLAVLMLKNKITLLNTALFFIISIFGFLSLSKSFLLVWCSLILLITFFSVKISFKRSLIISFLVIVLLLVINTFEPEAVNSYMTRFSTDKGSSMSEITTGRSVIWSAYIDKIFSDDGILFYGAGLNGPFINGKGPHNTFIELLYSFGIIGSLMYIYILLKCIFINKYKKINYIYFLPLIIFLLRAFAIGILTNDNTPFYFCLITLIINHNFTSAYNKNNKSYTLKKNCLFDK